MTTPQLRSLERKLVKERAEQAVKDFVYDLLQQWDIALSQGQPPPDPLDSIRRLILSGFYLPHTVRATEYLERCRSNNRMPKRRPLFEILIPWCYIEREED